jgi:uncharacterized repeat protein (TIGR01451 family)
MRYNRQPKPLDFPSVSRQERGRRSLGFHLRNVLVALIAVIVVYNIWVVVKAQTSNLIVNGGFEEPVISGGFQVFSSIHGWAALPGRPDFEIQNGGAYGAPFEGNQLCELDAFAPSAIFQDVPTAPSRVYELSFAFSARPGTPLTDNVLRVSWGGVDITTLAEDGTGLSNTSWKVHKFQVLGGPDTTTRLLFEDLGVANTLGTYIDNVSVVDLGFVITTSLPRHIQLGVPFSTQFQAGGGQMPLMWSLVGGALPTGLNLGADGVLSGNPATLGQFTFTIRVTDFNGQMAEKEFTVEGVLVLPPPDIRIHKIGTRAVPGRTVDYFILVENIGIVTANNVKVIEFLDPPTFFTLIATFPTPDAIEQSRILWTLPSLPPSQATILSYSVKLDPSIALGTNIRGQACNLIELIEKQGEPCTFCITICLYGHASDCILCLKDICRFPSSEPSGDCATHDQPARGAVDPNEKGVVAKKFIQPNQLLVYPIHFENIGDVEARDVFVTDALDPNLDTSTLKLLTPTGGSFDVATRTVKWNLLNRNLEPGETDNVLLSIRPHPGLPSGTVIRNKATIQFEVFQPFVTNEVVNIIDTSVPKCTVNPLPAQTSSEEFRISWSGMDEVGEIEAFTIFVQKDGGNFTRFLETSETEAMFKGVNNSTYGFFCVAKDTAGNIEAQTLAPETTTTIVPPVQIIEIDIKPGGFPNSINPKSQGVIPVAILSNNGFAAANVNPASVRFGAIGTEAAAVKSAMEDVDGDGDLDMVLHFRTQDTGIVCGSTKASITGKTLGGREIKGTDSVRTVGCN